MTGGLAALPPEKMNFPHIDRELFWTPALKHFIGNFMKWHHLHTLFYKIKIVHIKPESQLILPKNNKKCLNNVYPAFFSGFGTRPLCEYSSPGPARGGGGVTGVVTPGPENFNL